MNQENLFMALRSGIGKDDPYQELIDRLEQEVGLEHKNLKDQNTMLAGRVWELEYALREIHKSIVYDLNIPLTQPKKPF